MSGRGALAAAVSAAVAVALGTALWVVGSPAAERERRLDRERESDLRNLVQAVDAYARKNSALPADLDSLMRYRRTDLDRTDPETEAPYEYRALGEHTYELCATFALDRLEPDPATPWLDDQELWRHPAGRHCYRLEIPSGDP